MKYEISMLFWVGKHIYSHVSLYICYA